jgi:hypothetical protein
MNLPSLKTVKDMGRAVDKVMDAIRRGQMTAAEAEKMMSLLENGSRLIERIDYEERLEKVEEIVTRRAQKQAAGSLTPKNGGMTGRKSLI